MSKSHSPEVDYEGASSKISLAFKHYNLDESVEGKTMREHLRFAAPYWLVLRRRRNRLDAVGRPR